MRHWRVAPVVAAILLIGAGPAPGSVSRDALLLNREGGAISIVDAATGHARRLTRGSEAVWSPRGDRFAFTHGGDLFVLQVVGRGVRRLTTDGLVQHNPVWSPDGKRIAYLQQHPVDHRLPLGPTDDVAVIELDTSDLVQLTTDPDNKLRLSWSPDGETLAYEIHRRFRTIVALIDAATGKPVGNRFDGSYPIWSPSGRRVAYVSADQRRALLVVARSDGSAARILFRGARDEGIDRIAWSPGGRLLCFVYVGGSAIGPRLEVVDTVTARTRRVPRVRNPAGWLPVAGEAIALPTPVRNFDDLPAWSPDGRRIAFVRYEPRHRSYVLAVVNRDATNLRVLLRSKRSIGAPLWRPRSR
jgi:Tol biopolymer transport system component